MNKKYEKPIANISAFESEDVITTSGVGTNATILGSKNVEGAAVYSSAWKDIWNQ